MNLRAETSDRGVLTLTLDRAEKKNALTQAMYQGLCAHLTEAAQDPEVRVVVLTGAGSAFTAGNDLQDFMQAPPTSASDSPVIRFLLTLVDFPKPLMAAVRGPAVGVGTTLLFHCDLVYVTEDSRFVLPFVGLGLVPEGGSSLLLPRAVGLQRASEALFLGEPLDAQTAYRWGWVNQVVAADSLDDLVRERAEALSDQPVGSLMHAKDLLRGPHRTELRDTIMREAEVFMQRLTSPEAQEAFTAFFEKRKPDFRRVEGLQKNP